MLIKCIKLPLGEYGLEGFELDNYYKANKCIDKNGKPYWRIFLDNDYYETCSSHVLRKFFEVFND